MTSQNALFHAYLRPAMLQILRATGYHSTSPAVLDCVTDLAARYLSLLCERTADHAAHGASGGCAGGSGEAGDFGVPEVRLALRDAGALLPERAGPEQLWRGEEDLRGVEEFAAWVLGARMRELTEFARGDGDSDEVDYLNGEQASPDFLPFHFHTLHLPIYILSFHFHFFPFFLDLHSGWLDRVCRSGGKRAKKTDRVGKTALKKRHNKTSDGSKFQGTILGRPGEAAEIEVEGGGGDLRSIGDWISLRSASAGVNLASRDGKNDHDGAAPLANGRLSPTPSSGLSSVGDRVGEGLAPDNDDGDDKMDLS